MKKENKEIIAYKGFDKNLKCRDYQYEIGKTFEHDGAVKACESGFHACEYPLDVFSYYPPSSSRFAIVKMHGETSKDSDDTKIASAKITIETEIKLPEMINRAVDWIKNKINWSDDNTSNTGDRSAATNTGNRSAATNTGYQSAATNTGDWSAATNTGDRSAATNTGDWSAATNTGDRSAATNTGDWSAATNTGDWSAATNTGYQSAATNTGNRSAATNTGNRSAATNTGNRSAATNTGYQSAATNTGNRSAAEVSGCGSVAIAIGRSSKSKADNGGAIVCVYRDCNGDLMHIKASKVGENGIKANTWYTLDADGEFVEVENDE